MRLPVRSLLVAVVLMAAAHWAGLPASAVAAPVPSGGSSPASPAPASEAGAAEGFGRPVFSTWLGGAEDDGLVGVVVLTDGTILVAGNAEDTGALIRLTADGQKVLSRRRTEGPVTDLDRDAAGRVLAAGAFGVVQLSPDAREILWHNPTGGPDARVAPGPGGGAVVLAAKTVTVVAADGRTAASWKVPGGYVEDVACDPAAGRIFVAGFDNKRGRKYPVQVAFVYAYDAEGRCLWKAYGWGGKEVDDRGLMADTRGYRLALGADGRLYVAGESAGGNTMWTRQSLDLDERAPLVEGDKYQRPFNTRANHITFVGRLDPATGRCEGGTMLLARLSSGRGNTIRPRALAADAEGTVYVGGASAWGAPVSEGAFGRGEPSGAWFCVFGKAFARRFATTLCDGRTTAVALGPEVVVLVGEGKGGLPTVRPFQRALGGGVDGWIVVLRRK